MFKKTKIAAVTAAVLGMSMANVSAAETKMGYLSTAEAGSPGQVLIFPYYNVNNGFTTAFNIVNTKNEVKALKIRFRESNDSNDVLDFNVYMSPYDVFTLGVSASNGDVILNTTDTTCTHPKIPEGGVAFRDVYDSVDETDLREGYLEVIEMGVISAEGLDDGDFKDVVNAIVKGVTHKDGVPVDCAVIENAWQDGAFIQGGAMANTFRSSDSVNPKAIGYPDNAALGGGTTSDSGWYGKAPSDGWLGALRYPSGGLVGSSILIDTVNIAGFVTEPTAINNYSMYPQHYLSSDENFYLLPSLASGSVSTVAGIQQGNIFGGYWSTSDRDWGLDDPLVAPRDSVPSGINPMPIAHVMAVSKMANQYFVDGDTATDWVVATPMRKHAIWNDYMYVEGDTADAGDKDIIVDEGASGSYWKFVDASDVNAKFVYWDREEAQVQPEPGDFSPPVTSPEVSVPFEREVNIFVFAEKGGSDPSVLGSENATTISLASGFVNGWGSFDFSNYNISGDRYSAWVSGPSGVYGVPLHGFQAARGPITGGAIGETFPHIIERMIMSDYD